VGSITEYNQNNFISAEQIYSKIRREFKSLTASNLIDDGDFPVYTSEVLRKLGNSAMQECEVILELEDKKHPLPYNFSQLHSAWRCEKCNDHDHDNWLPQTESVVRHDVSCELVAPSKCKIDCCYHEEILQRIKIQTFVKDTCHTSSYNITSPLRLTPNVKDMCGDKRLKQLNTFENEITITEGQVYANFKGCIYMKYFGFPLDKNGMPMIPDVIEIIKAVEWYIKYQLLLSLWYDDSIANLQNKWQKAEQLYEQHLSEARYLAKLPSFSSMINGIRQNRANNLTTFFSRNILKGR
jgi:hypothetical protein